ncbi:hypothetical protein FQN50_009218 [Emmonsiellopsis sp. PD_5]|nr:hypothetical protein FQN50_009218 [Emmonsiellopsis sp. PD_5]
MQLQIFISLAAFITTFANALALPPHSGEVGAPVAIRSDGKTCSSKPQCCNTSTSSEDQSLQKALKMIGMDKDAKKHGGSVATECQPMDGILNIDLLNGCKSNAVCCNENKMNGLIFLGCVPITLNL